MRGARNSLSLAVNNWELIALARGRMRVATAARVFVNIKGTINLFLSNSTAIARGSATGESNIPLPFIHSHSNKYGFHKCVLAKSTKQVQSIPKKELQGFYLSKKDIPSANQNGREAQ